MNAVLYGKKIAVYIKSMKTIKFQIIRIDPWGMMINQYTYCSFSTSNLSFLLVPNK